MSFLSFLVPILLVLFAQHSRATSDVPHAHFDFVWPRSRGGNTVFNPINAAAPFCGGYDTPSANRTAFPLSGGFVQLAISNWTQYWPAEGRIVDLNLFIVVRDDVGSPAFYTSTKGTVFPQMAFLHQTFVKGGNLCLGNITFPSAFNLYDGVKATLEISTGVSGFDPTSMVEPQIIANNKQCADIVFTNSTISTGMECINDPIILSTAGGSTTNVSYTPPPPTPANAGGSKSNPSSTSTSTGKQAAATSNGAQSGGGKSRTSPIASWQSLLAWVVVACGAMPLLF